MAADQTRSRVALGNLYSRLQDTLTSVGEIERAFGDLHGDELRETLREDLNTAVVALQGMRSKLAGMIESSSER